ncbi:MAG: flagellar hook-length control protein FliK [Oscillospiraceae bacterium]
MAVAMNAGGYMRSDFMISDAAIPMRMEELDAQAVQFAQFVSGMSGGEASAQYSEPMSDNALPENVQQLAQMVVDGELKLEDIPKELISAVDTIRTNSLKNASDKSKDSPLQDEKQELADIQKAAAQLAGSFVQADNIPSDKTAELSEITAVIAVEQTEAVQAAEHNPTPVVQNEFQPKQTVAKAVVTDEKHFAISRESEQTAEIPVMANAESEKLENSLSEDGRNALAQALKNGEISKPEVRTVSRESSRQKSEDNEMPEAIPTAKDSVKSVKEELEMLKSAKAKPIQTEPTEPTEPTEQVKQTKQTEQTEQTKPNGRQAEPKPESVSNPAAADSPIVFTRANGEQVTVKPSEAAAQAAQRIEQTIKQTTEDAAEYTLELNPEELGKITVKLTKAADGAVSVTVAAENARTQRILEQHSETIQSNLRDSGIQLDSWQTVNESEQDAHAQDYNGSSKNPYHRDEAKQEDDSDEGAFAELLASM